MYQKTVFQFHKGTIKTNDNWQTTITVTDFNSIKVRLKPEEEVANQRVSAFQFHKGTIKTRRQCEGRMSVRISIP